jgi:phage shock protein A
MADLEQQLAVAERTLGDLLSSARSAEQSAMDAIRCGNDQAAREALVEQRTQAERAAAVESDIGVLRGIVDECRDFLAKLPESAAVKL